MKTDASSILPSTVLGAHKVRVCIDRGGTFTDCVGVFPVGPSKDNPSGERTLVIKLLSEDPEHYEDAPREGIRRILEEATGQPHPRDKPLDTSNLESIRMGTTVATNALLERNGEPCALVTTKGFGDLLKIGNQARPKIFDLAVAKPDVVYQQAVEIDERVTLEGYTMDSKPAPAKNPEGKTVVVGRSGERVEILEVPDWEKVRRKLQSVYDSGIRSVAVCLMHAYTFAAHEEEVGRLAADIGFTHVTLSSRLVPMIKIVPRAHSATADAYLTPVTRQYVDGFTSGFAAGIDGIGVSFMQSDGGLADAHGFSGLRAVLSGPAAGVVGYAMTCYSHQVQEPVIGFDMGGTSTDVSRYDGRYEHVFETTIAGVAIQAPQLDIHTVAAGGGSRLFFRSGLMEVGPQSAGAHPGPACYRKGGPAAVTDANLVLGRLRAEHFPHIFGSGEDQPLDIQAARSRLEELAQEINSATREEKMALGQKSHEDKSVEGVALGFISVANESVCRAIRSLTEARGHETQKHALSCFGGAGGQHACAVAERLGIRRVFVHRLASVLSAYGLGLAEVVDEAQAPSASGWNDSTRTGLFSRLEELVATSRDRLAAQGFTDEQISSERFLNMRYEGTDAALMVPEPEDKTMDFGAGFEAMHKREFGFVLQGRAIVVDDLRVRSNGARSATRVGQVHEELKDMKRQQISDPASHLAFDSTVRVYFDGGYHDTPVFRLDKLVPGEVVNGPALILDNNNTVLVEPKWIATVTSTQIVLEMAEPSGAGAIQAGDVEAELDPILLAVFGHRFMSIAEQMGRTLEMTSVSTNIKERLDFSCALFDQTGGLVANAPHIPVHLGSMAHAVRYQLSQFKDALVEGDVILANHPLAGGSHLPDITIITPVFKDGRIIFVVASRGHHADIGGITPGSMPPTSRELVQEGARSMGMKIVRQGQFQEDDLRQLLIEEPATHPDCTGTRNYRDVLSDLKAQIAANHRGITLVRQLCKEYGLETVQAYMVHIQRTAEAAVRSLLQETRLAHGSDALVASDSMDDGSRICLRIDVAEDGSAVFDFEGTSSEVYANTNAPPSVTHSAIIYCLRCMVQSDLPLNQGCLAPVTVRIPKGSLLSPSPTAAVVGGNVLTSQRLCDVILSAFGAAAASQGCMNNLTFGVPPTEGRTGWGYYETIAGGHGAGPSWDGQSGVHTHMTNTRITDPEVLERRYPVILHRFSLRPNSGGAGAHPGGHGCVRDIEFLQSMAVSLLTERRVLPPPGLHGGASASCGVNLWKHCSTNASSSEDNPTYLVRNLGGKNSVFVGPGDHIVIMTPGGGGYGSNK